MTWLRVLALRFFGMFGKRRRDAQLEEELQSHLEMLIEQNLQRGMPAEEARRAAKLELGGAEQIKEAVRDQRGLPFLESLIADTRFALRMLRKSPGFTAVAILTLALGTSATTIVFSITDGVFFRAVPYKDFDKSVVFEMRNLANVGGWKGRNFFYPEEVRAFREENHVFEDTIAYDGVRALYDNGRFSSYWPRGEVVTTNTFDYLGVSPLLGRTFLQRDGAVGAPPVFVMNYRFWQREFGGDPRILGSSFVLDGRPTTLVGIMPQQFNAFSASFWLPAIPAQKGRSLDGGASLMGRLKPGVSVQTAGADLNSIAHRLQKANPDGNFPDKFAIIPETLLDSLIGGFKKTIYALLAAVFLLLLIACSNVASLLLARATVREREMAMRATLGATRGRLIRQLIVESFVLSAAASAVGCVLAYFGLNAVIALIPAGTLPNETVIHLNAPVLLLALGVAALTSILCGLAPALHVVPGDLQVALTGSGGDIKGGFRRGWFRAGLVVSEVALSILLLISAGLFIRSFIVLTRVDLGFNAKNVAYFRVDFPATYNTDVPHSRERKNILTAQLLDRLQHLPGVTAVSESVQQPPLMYDWSDTIIPGRPHTERWETRFESVSEDYFQTLQVPLIRGRFFTKDDVSSARFVMVVNDSFSRQYFPNEDPIGHKVKLEVLDRAFLDAPHDTYFEIVGVVGDYKTRDYDNPSWENFPEAFFPYSVQGYSWRTFMMRTAADPNLLLKTVGGEIRDLDPSVSIAASGTLKGSLDEFYRGPRFELVTFAAFAGLGLVLVAVGVFSVMAYTVSLQTREIGIRMALGAQQGDVSRMVLRKGLGLVAAGVAIGLCASFALTRFLASQIWGVSSTDPWTFSAVIAVIVVVGLTACYIPARRAMKVDPMVALRYE